MSEGASAVDLAAVKESIASEILRVQEESYGVGADAVAVTLDTDLVVVVLDIQLAVAERTLLAAGHADSVKRMRESFQAAIAPTFRAIVEHATGRAVRSFMSTVSIEPLYAVELFRLEPSPEGARP